MRLIDADKINYTTYMLSSKGNGNYENVGFVTEGEIDAQPTIDAVPVEWIESQVDKGKWAELVQRWAERKEE